ncbi:hypothetical protein SDC9_191493 [bioreactor metagenome]|uniref:Uncharacterized protein n=1 Tax=bioreactor metagenome TaxID=1076179 RepID=A0A645HZL8_9ZZZZ
MNHGRAADAEGYVEFSPFPVFPFRTDRPETAAAGILVFIPGGGFEEKPFGRLFRVDLHSGRNADDVEPERAPRQRCCAV